MATRDLSRNRPEISEYEGDTPTAHEQHRRSNFEDRRNPRRAVTPESVRGMVRRLRWVECRNPTIERNVSLDMDGRIGLPRPQRLQREFPQTPCHSALVQRCDQSPSFRWTDPSGRLGVSGTNCCHSSNRQHRCRRPGHRCRVRTRCERIGTQSAWRGSTL